MINFGNFGSPGRVLILDFPVPFTASILHPFVYKRENSSPANARRRRAFRIDCRHQSDKSCSNKWASRKPKPAKFNNTIYLSADEFVEFFWHIILSSGLDFDWAVVLIEMSFQWAETILHSELTNRARRIYRTLSRLAQLTCFGLNRKVKFNWTQSDVFHSTWWWCSSFEVRLSFSFRFGIWLQ